MIYTHSDLNISVTSGEYSNIALIGYVIDPLNPDKTSEEIISSLADRCSTQGQFFSEIGVFTGRYTLFYKNGSSFILSGDACRLKQIYCGYPDGNPVITSSLIFLDAFKCPANFYMRIIGRNYHCYTVGF